MHVLHCSDIHAKEAWYHWLAKESVNVDLVCLAGDLLDLNPFRFTTGQMDKVVALTRKIRTPLAVCSGNHDSVDGDDIRLINAAWMEELRRPKVWIDGDRFELGGHSFRVIPWMSPLPPASADEIWLSHSPPDQCPTGIVRGGVDFGDGELGDLCRSGNGPWLALSGHTHACQAWSAKIGQTWSLNPGCNLTAPSPNHIIIELGRPRCGIATYHLGGRRGLGGGLTPHTIAGVPLRPQVRNLSL